MKKKIILLITIIMSIFMLVGCTNKKEAYTKDQENLQKIIELNKLVEDTYSQVREVETDKVIKEFETYCDKIVKEAKKIDVKTKEGKAVKDVYIERIEYSIGYLINNWNDTSKPLINDQGLFDIDSKLSKLVNQFLNKKEEVINDEINKSHKIETMYFIFGIVVGTVLFILLNKMVNIYYFGCSGVTIVWTACVGISTYVIAPIVGELLIWIMGIGVVVIIYSAIKNKSNNKSV
ncbi:hypothetical protein C4R89_12380 [Clostridioides difficile]|nr:hypothetical protein [Clostridioides difficile]MDB0440329.1 hypothetical protein [Clostridioides difficile]